MSDVDGAARRAADALRSPDRLGRPARPPSAALRRTALVLARNDSAGTVDLLIGSKTVNGVPFLAGFGGLFFDQAIVQNVDGAMIAVDSYPRTWQALTLANGATNWGGRTETAAIRPLPGRRVVLRGVILLGASGVGASCLTIPSGLRPAYTHYLTTSAGGSPGSPSVAIVQATAAGDLLVSTGVNSDFLRLDDIGWTLD